MYRIRQSGLFAAIFALPFVLLLARSSVYYDEIKIYPLTDTTGLVLFLDFGEGEIGIGKVLHHRPYRLRRPDRSATWNMGKVVSFSLQGWKNDFATTDESFALYRNDLGKTHIKFPIFVLVIAAAIIPFVGFLTRKAGEQAAADQLPARRASKSE